YINLRESCERLRERLVVLFLACFKAHVFEQRHIAVFHVRDDLLRHFTDGVVAEDDGVIDQRVQVISHRAQRFLFAALALRPAEEQLPKIAGRMPAGHTRDACATLRAWPCDIRPLSSTPCASSSPCYFSPLRSTPRKSAPSPAPAPQAPLATAGRPPPRRSTIP